MVKYPICADYYGPRTAKPKSNLHMQQNKLYVGNLSFSVDEAQLRSLFSSYGDISELALIKDRDTGQSKGFAFVTFSSQQAAEKALEQNGRDLGGRTLKVNIAVERESRGGGGRGGRSGGGRPGGGGRAQRW